MSAVLLCTCAVTTTVTVSRLQQLQLQCASWPGPLVASVWAPVVLPATTQTDLSVAAGKRHLSSTEKEEDESFFEAAHRELQEALQVVGNWWLRWVG